MKISAIVWGLAGTILFSTAAESQSLAEIARKEAERRKTIQAPGKVYTDADLRRYATVPPPEAPPLAAPSKDPSADDKAAARPDATAAAGSPGAAGAAATPVEPSVDLGEQYWRKLISDARGALARSSSSLAALQQRSQSLLSQAYALEDPAQRNAAAAARNQVVRDIRQLKQEMAAQEAAIAKIEADGRKAGIPPGWLR